MRPRKSTFVKTSAKTAGQCVKKRTSTVTIIARLVFYSRTEFESEIESDYMRSNRHEQLKWNRRTDLF